MTNRERFHAVLNGEPVDRGPVLEWASWWDKTLHIWEGEGMPAGLSGQEVFDYFGLDRHKQFWMRVLTPDCPGKQHGAPRARDDEEYEAYKKYLYPANAVELIRDKLAAAKAEQDAGTQIVWYTLEGFFWFPREILGIEPHLYAFYDQPELYHRICEDLLAWHLRVIEEMYTYLTPDFMTLAEDMSYNHGPMISRATYDEFIAPYYRRLIPEITKRGTRVLIDSDGDISSAIPWFIDAGVEGALPLERQAGIDIAELQVRHPDFLWVGGFDKMCLLKDREAIDREFERILPMLRKGRFIPSVDHQTPPGTTMQNYRYYVDRLHHFSQEACKDR